MGKGTYPSAPKRTMLKAVTKKTVGAPMKTAAGSKRVKVGDAPSAGKTVSPYKTQVRPGKTVQAYETQAMAAERERKQASALARKGKVVTPNEALRLRKAAQLNKPRSI